MRFLILSIILTVAAVSGAKDIQKTNINTAPADSLAAHLPGIGPTVAERIVTERKDGRFADCADVQSRVKGIGAKKLAKLCLNLEF